MAQITTYDFYLILVANRSMQWYHEGGFIPRGLKSSMVLPIYKEKGDPIRVWFMWTDKFAGACHESG